MAAEEAVGSDAKVAEPAAPAVPPAGPPPLTEEQARVLLEKKKAHAASKGEPDNACQNLKCRCVECTCGAACTCNISPEVNCDECKDFKAQMAARQAEAAERLRAAEELFAGKVEPNFPDVSQITAAEILALQQESGDSVLLVDMRPDVERAVSTLPGAVTLEALEADAATLSAGKLVVPFCTIGGRAAPVTRRLMECAERPWREVRNFKLSCIGWAHAGQQFVAPDGATTNRVYVPAPGLAALFPSGYEIVIPAPAA